MAALRLLALLAVGVSAAVAALAMPMGAAPGESERRERSGTELPGEAADLESPENAPSGPASASAPGRVARESGPRWIEAAPGSAALDSRGRPTARPDTSSAGPAGTRVAPTARRRGAEPADPLAIEASARSSRSATPWSWSPGAEGSDPVASRGSRGAGAPALTRGSVPEGDEAPSLRVTMTFEYFRGGGETSSSASTGLDPGGEFEVPSDPPLDHDPESDTGIQGFAEPTSRRAGTGGGREGTAQTHGERGTRPDRPGAPPPRQDRGAGTRAAQAQSL